MVKQYDYDAVGNITKKSDFGDTYIYDPVRSHAVKQVMQGNRVIANYNYDANGFMTNP